MSFKIDELFKTEEEFKEFVVNEVLNHIGEYAFNVSINVFDTMEYVLKEKLAEFESKEDIENTVASYYSFSKIEDQHSRKIRGMDIPLFGILTVFKDNLETLVIEGYEDTDPLNVIKYVIAHECRHIMQDVFMRTNYGINQLDVFNQFIKRAEKSYEANIMEIDADKYAKYKVFGKDTVKNPYINTLKLSEIYGYVLNEIREWYCSGLLEFREVD